MGSSNRKFKPCWIIFLVNVTYKNYLTYTYYINLVAAIMRLQKFLLTWRELPTLAISHHVNVRENY